MGSYELSAEHALQSAIKAIQLGRAEVLVFSSTIIKEVWLTRYMKAVKLEGGAEMAGHIKKITDMGISVLGHIGLTPQRQHSLGGFRVQGKTAASAEKLVDDALAIQQAGCFGMVVEAVPAAVANLITKHLRIPTIGIGAGNGCSGQVLVQVDMLGNFPSGRFMPKFVKVCRFYSNWVWRHTETCSVDI